MDKPELDGYVLIRPTPEDVEMIDYGTFSHLFELMEARTKANEAEGVLLVSEEWVNSKCVIRDFATQEQGLVDTLIICGGVAGGVRAQSTL